MDSRGTATIAAPLHPLAKGSVLVYPTDGPAHLSDMDDAMVSALHASLRDVVDSWRLDGRAAGYMVIGVDDLLGGQSFRYQAVPYPRAVTDLENAWRQFRVIRRLVFGMNRAFRATLTRNPASAAQLARLHPVRHAGSSSEPSRCPFCRRDVLQSQIVMEGRTVVALYNFAPIGLRGDKLHFLIIPKAHRPGFEDLTREEHREAFELARRVVHRLSAHFGQGAMKRLYTYHKTGPEAGQSVPHWHLHLVLFRSHLHDIWARSQVLLKILAPPSLASRLSRSELAAKQAEYSRILSSSDRREGCHGTVPLANNSVLRERFHTASASQD